MLGRNIIYEINYSSHQRLLITHFLPTHEIAIFYKSKIFPVLDRKYFTQNIINASYNKRSNGYKYGNVI